MASARHSLGLTDWYDRWAIVRDRYDPAIIPSIDTVDPTTWRPYAFPWPAASTADQWGVAFPAGIVAVSLDQQEALGGVDGDPCEDRIEEALARYAVPGVLPLGYTENRYEEDPNAIGVLGSGAPRPSIDIATQRRTNTGLEPVTWTPDVRAIDGTLDTGSIFSVPLSVERASYDQRSIGYRKVQVRLRGRLAVPISGATFAGSIDLTLSHNADGTLDLSADGDTIDFTHSWVPADFTTVGLFAESAWVDAGAILPTLGVATYFLSCLDTTGLTLNPTGTNAWVAELRLSHNCDVPFPSLVTGFGNLIAPGGYVP